MGNESTQFILLTDIWRSSHLAEAFPQEYSAALDRHNSVVEAAITAHGGRVLKGLGDGYLALFDDAAACAACAVDVQRQLGDSQVFPDETPLRLRVACHAGPLRASGGDFFGPALNRAARICQVCNPGQVLLSSRVRQDLKEEPEGSALSDIGDHRLRDLSEPEHLFQLLHPAFAVQEFPPLASLDSRPNNLFPLPGAFIGRAAELQELGAMLLGRGTERQRLITIIAPGGYGKSRLTAQLCANLIGEFKNGVFEVRLASLSDASRIPEAIATATGFQFYGSREPRQQILDYLREKEMLLHFDNFEHLMAGAGFIGEILQYASKIQVIVTSREALRLREERIYRLDPLPTEAGGDAMQLFTDRAAMVKQGFALDEKTAPSVQHICAALDGVPLAIELFAAWADGFSLNELAAEVDHQLDLTARMTDVADRHRSVRASCDWSWAQLGDEQRSLLRRCSVFRGGFFFEAGEAVLGVVGMALRRGLATLCDKSWLYTRELDWSDDEGNPTTKTRWQLRDAAAREYAWEKLVETKTQAEAAA